MVKKDFLSLIDLDSDQIGFLLSNAINIKNNKITNFSFTRSDFNLSTLDTVVVTDDKIQETKTQNK